MIVRLTAVGHKMMRGHVAAWSMLLLFASSTMHTSHVYAQTAVDAPHVAQVTPAKGGAPAPAKGSKPSAAKPAPSGGPLGAGDPNDTRTKRVIIHSEAYKKREHLGDHINFKITPPEKRGAKGRVLVEIYNYSAVHIGICDFWLYMTNTWGDRVEVHITADDIPPKWSALRWVVIPGAKKIPEIENVQVQNLKVFDNNGKAVKLKHYIDLIKI